MLNLNLTNIAKACDGKIVYPEGYEISLNETKEAKGVVIDSRQVEEGYVFIATPGEKVDGHSFIGQVSEKGAMAVVCQKLPETISVPCIQVEDSFKALKDIATFYREQLDIKVVGITGSVGKTSTKEFIATVLAQKYKVLKTEGNYNNEVGLPLTVLRITSDIEVAVLEMGISEFGEMTRLSAIAKPDICVITNIGTCHLENLGDRDGVLKAKTECFTSMNQSGYAVLLGDDDKLSTIDDVYGRKPVRFGSKESYDVYAEDIDGKGLFGSDITIVDRIATVKKKRVHVPLPGAHMVNNALAATAVAHILDMDIDDIAKGIETVTSTKGRSNILQSSRYTIIDDCYNANPVSMKAAIDLLKTSNTRTVAIMGDMFELGSDENALHEDVGKYAAASGIEVIITIGKLAKYINKGALSEVRCEAQEIIHFDDKETALKRLDSILLEDDTVLIKASHGMHFEELVEYLSK